MNRKAERIATDLSERLKTWKDIDSITLAESAESDRYDPYFFVSLDVYYKGILPTIGDREKLFADTAGFESSNITAKDRFLVENIAVRVEYKDIERINDILQRTQDNMWVFRQTGTYMFYRLENAAVLVKNSAWIDDVREQLTKLPDGFWQLMINSSQATMEHYLSDLIASVMREDKLFFLISSAGFIKSFLSLLFVINRAFDPSGRKLFEMVWSLPELPENFKGRFHSFLRDNPEFPPSRKQELAELMAKSVIRMS